MQYAAGPEHKLMDMHVVRKAALGCVYRSFASALAFAFVSDYPSCNMRKLCSGGAPQLSEGVLGIVMQNVGRSNLPGDAPKKHQALYNIRSAKACRV